MNRKWWKIYFFLALVLTFAEFVLLLFVDDGRTLVWWEWAYVPLYTIQIVGLFGFVYRHRLAIPLLWKFAFVASVAYEVWELLSIATDPQLHGADQAIFFVATVAMGLALQVPMLLGLFLYGFRSKELW
jgi:hypothetical protein